MKLALPLFTMLEKKEDHILLTFDDFNNFTANKN